MKLIKLLFFVVVLGFLWKPALGEIFHLEIDGIINPVVADYIEYELERADKKNAQIVIIQMDTPGGLMDSMRQIVKAIEKAPFPVIVYVGDAGARAASAGVFITLSADIAVMAEGTNIGAAHPVKLGGEDVSKEIAVKMSEDARAFIKAIAQKHNRNYEWAEKAVTESVSITSKEAVQLNVVDYEVENFNELIEILDGKSIIKGGEEIILDFSGGITRIEMSFFKKFLNYIAHPNLAYILLILGVYGLIYEFSNPGIGFGLAMGSVSLLLAALSFQMIPINVVGILLIILGVILMSLDIFVPSMGILTVGGAISFLMGSLTLFDMKEFPFAVSLGLILGVTVTTTLFFMYAVSSGIIIQRKKVITGRQGMLGLEGEARSNISKSGEIFVRGEIWSAESVNGKIKKGATVKVVKVKGNKLWVEKES